MVRGDGNRNRDRDGDREKVRDVSGRERYVYMFQMVITWEES